MHTGFLTTARVVLLVRWIKFTVSSLHFEITANLNQFDELTSRSDTKSDKVPYADVIKSRSRVFTETRLTRVCMSLPIPILSEAKTWKSSSEPKESDGDH